MTGPWIQTQMTWISSDVECESKDHITLHSSYWLQIKFFVSENDDTCREVIDKEYEKNTANTASALEEIA